MPTKILVVEDDRDIRRNMKALLEGEDYEVVLAENGQIALNYLASGQSLPDLILLDLMMPVMDGFQFREAQEKIALIASIPVVLLTADGHTQEKQYKTGARAALQKPASIEAILNIVQSIVVGK